MLLLTRDNDVDLNLGYCEGSLVGLGKDDVAAVGMSRAGHLVLEHLCPHLVQCSQSPALVSFRQNSITPVDWNASNHELNIIQAVPIFCPPSINLGLVSRICGGRMSIRLIAD